MTFVVFNFAIQVVVVLFPGLVMHHALARRMLMLDEDQSTYPIDEMQLLALGILPALALANTVGTVLAIFHLFYWWAYLAAVLLIVGWLCRDAVATLSAIGSVLWAPFRLLSRGNLMGFVAVAIFLQVLAGMLIEAR